MRRFLAIFAALALFFTPISAGFAHTGHEGGAEVSAFFRDDCKHCQDLEEYVDTNLRQKHPDIVVNYYDLDEERNQTLFNEVAEYYGLVKATPIILVGDKLIQGFGNAETTGVLIESLIDSYEGEALSFIEIVDGGASLANEFDPGSSCDDEGCTLVDDQETSYKVTLPIIGSTIDVGKFSLTAMSLVLGLVDGFNPCALWVLLMFLLILSQVGDRKKMFQYAGIFILAEAIMYYLILNVWLTAWDFIALNHIVTPAIGFLSLGSGGYFIYRFATFKPVCTVTDAEDEAKLTAKVQELVKKPMSWGVFLGILGVAFSVNIFEFACSIGIPQAFTKILELNELTMLGTQWYMLLYILMYMFDDLIVFGLALWGMEKLGVTQKYSKWASLIGGILMIILGVLMLYRPDLLVF